MSKYLLPATGIVVAIAVILAGLYVDATKEAEALRVQKTQVERSLAEVNDEIIQQQKRNEKDQRLLLQSRQQLERINDHANELRNQLQSLTDTCAARPIEPSVADRLRQQRAASRQNEDYQGVSASDAVGPS